MRLSPYRTPAPRPARDELADASTPDTELLPIFALLWLSAVARVVLAVHRGEVFGAEPSLACLALPALPLLLKDAIAAWLRPRGPAPPDTDLIPSLRPTAPPK